VRRGDLVTVALQGSHGKPITTAPRERVGRRIGRVDAATMHAVNQALAVFLGIA
jgi:mRNA-degrading endonuclease toxin of MazEF toxin-antitoxin module